MDIAYWAAGAFAGEGGFVFGWGHGLHILLLEGLDLQMMNEFFFHGIMNAVTVESWSLRKGLLQNLECRYS